MGKKTKKTATPKNAGGANGGCASIDSDGRMAERDGRRLYDLLAFLAEIAVPRLESRRKGAQQFKYRPLGWRTFDYNAGAVGMAANPIEIRLAVMTFILKEIDWLVNEVESKRHDALFLRLFSRRLTLGDRNVIRSWKMHVEDDFFYVTTRPKEGAVLVQCGKVKEYEKDLGEFHKADIHEPRVFVVRGLSDPIKNLVEAPISRFRADNPAIVKKHRGATIALIKTTLIPYNGGITYMTMIQPPSCNHYGTPKEMADAANIAFEAAKSAFDYDSCVALYRTLGDADAHVCRLANFSNDVPSELQLKGTKPDGQRTNNNAQTTKIIITQMFWFPYRSQNDPRMVDTMLRVCEGPKPFKLEGMKRQAGQEFLVDDDDVCPFHNDSALKDTSPIWKDCCKKEYLRRKYKAGQKSNPFLVTTMYEPVEPEEAEAITERALRNVDTGTTLNLMKYLRLGYMDVGLVRLKIPLPFVKIVKERMDNAPPFHAVLDHKWIYMGYIPVKFPFMGLLTMGDIELFPETGVFEGNAMTNRRLTALIREMKEICTGIPILDAAIEMQPSYKMKPDKDGLKRNQELLQEGLDLKVSHDINKKENESFVKKCAYCGASEKHDGASLSRCPCKLVYFCSVDHQRSHWANHKKECKEARAKMKPEILD